MKRNIKTPTHPSAAPICEGFIICIKEKDIKLEPAKKKAKDAVCESLKSKGWDVKPLGNLCRNFEVRKSSGKQKIPMHLAWKFARKIEQHKNIHRAEPALIMPGIDPSPSQVYTSDEIKQIKQIDTEKGKSLRSMKDLPCTDPEQDPKNLEWNLILTFVKDAKDVKFPDPNIGKRDGEGIVISHPDTGYTNHYEIDDKLRLLIKKGYDFEDGKHPPLDKMIGSSKGHGTSTSSVIMSAIGPKQKPPYVSGVAPKATLIPMRVSTSVVHFSFLNLALAIYKAIDDGHHIISMSLGGLLGWDYLHEAIEYAIKNDIILLAAAGNMWRGVVYPAAFDEVIAVAACNCEGKIWNQSIFRRSAYGRKVDIAAPGESVWRAVTKKSWRWKNYKYEVERSSGTSYAVAITAGDCALWLAHHGRKKLINHFGVGNLAGKFKDILKKKGVTTPLYWNTKKHGAGILNAKKLLEADLGPKYKASGSKTIPATLPLIRTQFPKINDYMDFFPGLDVNRVEESLSRILHTNTGKSHTFKSELSKELLFHIATNPEVRSTIAKEISSKISSKTFAKPLLLNNPRFRKSVSAKLKEYMVGKK